MKSPENIIAFSLRKKVIRFTKNLKIMLQHFLVGFGLAIFEKKV
jgi:hypothetical protein